MSDNSGIIYILSNKGMPGLIKIGKTGKETVHQRMDDLYSSGVPFPFACYFACVVNDYNEVEKTLHFSFSSNRANPKREFFDIEPEKIVKILKLVMIQDVTPAIQKELVEGVTESEVKASNEFSSSKRPRLNFIQIGISANSEIIFEDGESIARVSDEYSVEFNGETYSLTGLTKYLLKIDRPIQPSPYWTYNGKSLKSIYDEFHSGIKE